jgi:hypothetical protein
MVTSVKLREFDPQFSHSRGGVLGFIYIEKLILWLL